MTVGVGLVVAGSIVLVDAVASAVIAGWPRLRRSLAAAADAHRAHVLAPAATRGVRSASAGVAGAPQA